MWKQAQKAKFFFFFFFFFFFLIKMLWQSQETFADLHASMHCKHGKHTLETIQAKPSDRHLGAREARNRALIAIASAG